MITIEQLNFDKLKNPPSMFKVFEPTEEKMKIFIDKLMTVYLYLQDWQRNSAYLKSLIEGYDNNCSIFILYEICDFDGILGFMDIIPEYKCSFTLKPWNLSKVWGTTIIKQTRRLIKTIMDEFCLTRIETSTADPRIVRMGRMVGFELEGESENDFIWHKERRKTYFMSITRKLKEDN